MSKQETDDSRKSSIFGLVGWILIMLLGYFLFLANQLEKPNTDKGCLIPDDEVKEFGWVRCPDSSLTLKYQLIGWKEKRYSTESKN